LTKWQACGNKKPEKARRTGLSPFEPFDPKGIKLFDDADCSQLHALAGSGAFWRLPRRKSLKMLAFPALLLLTLLKNHSDHFIKINGF
jgi:hypothetical protein